MHEAQNSAHIMWHYLLSLRTVHVLVVIFLILRNLPENHDEVYSIPRTAYKTILTIWCMDSIMNMEFKHASVMISRQFYNCILAKNHLHQLQEMCLQPLCIRHHKIVFDPSMAFSIIFFQIQSMTHHIC